MNFLERISQNQKFLNFARNVVNLLKINEMFIDN